MLYARDGLNISMAAVAREAGVGKATLARHFTTKQQLIDAVFADRPDDAPDLILVQGARQIQALYARSKRSAGRYNLHRQCLLSVFRRRAVIHPS